MKKSLIFKPILMALALVVTMLALPLQAATQNYSTAVTGVTVIPVQLSGQYIATTSAVVRFALPFKAHIVGVTVSARASGGTSPTLTVDVNDDGVSVLSSAVSVTAGSVSEGTISNTSIADESVMTVDLTIGGTSPTWDDITVLLTVVRI